MKKSGNILKIGRNTWKITGEIFYKCELSEESKPLYV